MRITFLVFWYAILFSIFAASSKSAEAPHLIPKQFSAAIGGFLGGSYRVELLNGSLTYTAFDDGKPQPLKITPTAAQWREFRQTLDTLKIWQWRDTYRSGGVVDGTQWSLDIAYTDHTLKSHGDNNYPDATGTPNGNAQPTEAFKSYLAAIKKLLGGKDFQ